MKTATKASPGKKKKPGKSRGNSKRGSSRMVGVTQLLILGACTAGIAWSRPKVAESYKDLGTSGDIYAIPSEDQLVVFSLGYRSATADLLFGRTMVAAGVHFAEKRVFHHLDAYLKGIIALDPKYLDVYRYADTLLNLSTVEMPKENLAIAREIQERGLKEFPHDPQLWISTGQFMAYLAPNRFTDEKMKREWRLAAIPILQHACDIWPSREALPDTCLNSATLYNQAGEIGAAIGSLERLIAVSDDEGLRARAAEKLQRLTGERAARKVQESLRHLEPLREADLPAVSPLRYQLLSPPFDETQCVGASFSRENVDCATSFLDRSDILAKARER